MSEQKTGSHIDNEDLEKMFPGWSFVQRNFFQITALAIPFIGIVGFAAGTSFLDGWNRAAGIGSNLFPFGVNETILLGLQLTTPWAYSGGVIAAVVFYLYLTEMLTEWERARWGRESHWQRWTRNRLARRARTARKQAGSANRLSEPSAQAWKKLGPRLRWARRESIVSLKAKRWRKFGIRALALVLFLFGIGMTVFLNFLFRNLILGESHAEGVRDYARLYVAITGKLPLNFDDKISKQKLLEWSCDGQEVMWRYRSVEIPKDPGQPATKQPSYVLRSSDKLFFLVDSSGSRLHSFGDAPYSLAESSNRPLATLTNACK